MTHQLHRSLFLLAIVVLLYSCGDLVSPERRQYHLNGVANDTTVDIRVTSRFLGPTFNWSASSVSSPTETNAFGCRFSDPSISVNASSYQLTFIFRFDTSETTTNRLVIDKYEVLAENLRNVDWSYNDNQDTLVRISYEFQEPMSDLTWWSTSLAEPQSNASNSLKISSVEMATDARLGAGLLVSGSFDAVLGSHSLQSDSTIVLRNCTFEGFWQILDPH
ncbi:MAG: hypothetical protein AAGA85_03945 [Bacteroidota bacterium]